MKITVIPIVLLLAGQVLCSGCTRTSPAPAAITVPTTATPVPAVTTAPAPAG